MGHLAGPLVFPLGGDPDALVEKPIAVVLPAEQQSVVGAIVKLDGRSSISPRGDALSYIWEFIQIPIGSQAAHFGFANLEDDSSIVSFAPDFTGSYQVKLTVYDGTAFSDPAIGIVDCRVILVPHHQGFTPDASFIWNYLSDFWAKVDGRKKFETFWSAAIQLVASEQLKLYQYDYNKSIRDIQDVIQKRWISYSPSLVLDRTKVSFILADDQAGIGAITTVLDSATSVPVSPQPQYTSHVAVPVNEGGFRSTSYGQDIAIGRVLRVGGMSFTFARPSTISPSLDYGIFGITTTGTGNFSGGGFSLGMVGDTLRILSGVLAGDYLINGFSDANHITVDTTWPSSLTGIAYTVIPSTPTYNSCFTDQALIPAGLTATPWRFGSTIISQEFDFEQEGVTSGDIIEIEIARQDITLVSTIYAQVVSVDRNRLGFVLNLDDLVDGEPADWFSQNSQMQLASDLQVRGLALGISGELVYTTDSLIIKRLVSSAIFKRRYFETELATDDLIDVGLFKISARPVQIIRQSKIPVDDSVVSIPVLQEYIRQPDIVTQEDGSIQLVVEGGVVSASRPPYLLVENLDYILDGESQITGVCNVTGSSNEIQIPFGDLFDRSISQRDFIEVEAGGVVTQYEIRKILSADLLQVYPTPSVSLLLAPFVIKRRVFGRYIRFVNNTFTKTKVAPARFWAEVTYFDNSDSVEANFGVLVGLTREQLTQTNATAPYRSAVAGLMYALANGPTINNLTLSAQILLGLPFTQNAGVITSIVPDYRKREDGSPLYGQILVEVRDTDNKPTGVTNIYVYAQGAQIFDPISGKWLPAIPDFSGLAINPDTGREFAVGDVVGQFVVLSKGIQIQEYLATPDWTTDLIAQGNFASLIQRYHAFQLVMNADLVSAADINLASEFIQKAKPHYLKLTSSLLKVLQDTVDVEDALTIFRNVRFFDSVGLSLPSTSMFDDVDEDEAFISYDGNFYTRYISGDDLTTTKDSLQVSSATGGFTTAAAPHSYDTPFLKPGDLLIIIGGNNSGRYVVSSIDSDTVLTIESGVNFETLANQAFSVYRPLKNPIWYGLVNITNGNNLASVHEIGGSPAGLKSSGPSVGDRLVFYSGTTLCQRIYNVIEVNPDSVTPTIRVYPTPTDTTAQYKAWIIREPILTKNLVVPYGNSTPINLSVDITNGSNEMVWSAGMSGDEKWLNACLVRPGDTVTLSGIPYSVIANDLENRKIWVSPPASLTASNQSCYISRPFAPNTPISYAILDRVPDDVLQLDLLLSSSVTTDRLVTTASSTDVSTALSLDFSDLGVIPGDYLLVKEGADSSRDIGYGAGVFPILKLVSTTQLRLITELTATHGAPGILYGIRKLRPQ